MSDRMTQVRDMKRYYEELHHKFVTWYVTIIGFFLAGAIAAGEPTDPYSVWFGCLLLLASFVVTHLSRKTIFHYGERIDLLLEWIMKGSAPDDWETSHKDVGQSVKGEGSKFFNAIIWSLQICLIALVSIKFFL